MQLADCPRCYQKRVLCLMYSNRRCYALNDTRFKYRCPFYKCRANMDRSEIMEYLKGVEEGFTQGVKP